MQEFKHSIVPLSIASLLLVILDKKRLLNSNVCASIRKQEDYLFVNKNISNTIEKRYERLYSAIALKEPDRVPFAPKVCKAYTHMAGMTNFEASIDFRNLKIPIRKWLSAFEMDLFTPPSLYPLSVLEILGTNYIKWAGATHGFDLDAMHQILDKSFMGEDEYDVFLRDPSRFLFTKVFPERHGRLAGLGKLKLNNIVEYGHFSSMKVFADPEVRQALLSLMFAGEEVAKWQNAQAELFELAESMQCPAPPAAGQTMAYDMLADNLRGFINVPMDLFTIPEKVLAAIEYMHSLCEENIRGFAASGIKYVSIPLHGGADDFMSNETYLKYYWPFLRKEIELIVELGMTPIISCQGKYTNRLEILTEVPKGKVVYQFENVDVSLAKKVLGGVACISGIMPSTDLIFGKKTDIIEKTKRLIDVCAPGGGFIMGNNMPLDIYNEENMEAWYETILDYGKY